MGAWTAILDALLCFTVLPVSMLTDTVPWWSSPSLIFHTIYVALHPVLSALSQPARAAVAAFLATACDQDPLLVLQWTDAAPNAPWQHIANVRGAVLAALQQSGGVLVAQDPTHVVRFPDITAFNSARQDILRSPLAVCASVDAATAARWGVATQPMAVARSVILHKVAGRGALVEPQGHQFFALT